MQRAARCIGCVLYSIERYFSFHIAQCIVLYYVLDACVVVPSTVNIKHLQYCTVYGACTVYCMLESVEYGTVYGLQHMVLYILSCMYCTVLF